MSDFFIYLNKLHISVHLSFGLIQQRIGLTNHYQELKKIYKYDYYGSMSIWTLKML
jgi:hypothetical protein